MSISAQNRTLPDWFTRIRTRQTVDGTDLKEADLRKRLSTHLIPYDEMIKGDYESFLEVRAKLNELCMIGDNS